MILLSSALLFLLIGIVLVIIASIEKDSMLIGLLSASVPFIFISYWNFYSYRFEKITGSDGEYFTYGNSVRGGIGISYNKTTVVPFFLVLFVSSVLAIITFILSINRSTEDLAIGTLILSFLLSTILTVYFSLRIGRGLRKTGLKNSTGSQISGSEGEKDIREINDDIAVKIAFFFASIATIGLFPLVYYLIKKVRGFN